MRSIILFAIANGTTLSCDYQQHARSGDKCSDMSYSQYPWCGPWGRAPCLAFVEGGRGCDEFCLSFDYAGQGHAHESTRFLVTHEDLSGTLRGSNLPTVGMESVALNTPHDVCIPQGVPSSTDPVTDCASWYAAGHPRDQVEMNVAPGSDPAYRGPHESWDKFYCYGETTFDTFVNDYMQANKTFECTKEYPCPISVHSDMKSNFPCGSCVSLLRTPLVDALPGPYSKRYARVVTYHDILGHVDHHTPSIHDVVFIHDENEAIWAPSTKNGESNIYHTYALSNECEEIHEFAQCVGTLSQVCADEEQDLPEAPTGEECTKEYPCAISANTAQDCGKTFYFEEHTYKVLYYHDGPVRFQVSEETWGVATGQSDATCHDYVYPIVPEEKTSGAFKAIISTVVIIGFSLL